MVSIQKACRQTHISELCISKKEIESKYFKLMIMQACIFIVLKFPFITNSYFLDFIKSIIPQQVAEIVPSI
jgi:hypothetical protein